MKLKLILTFVCFATIFSCSKDEVYTGADDKPIQGEDVRYDDANKEKGAIRIYVSEELALQFESLAKTKAPVASALTKVDLSSINVKTLERVFPYSGKFEPRARKAGLHRWYDVTFEESTSVSKVAGRFTNIEGIEQIELKPIVVLYKAEAVVDLSPYMSYNAPQSIAVSETGLVFNDTRLDEQWHHINSKQKEDFVQGADINIKSVWEKDIVGHKSVIVAILDAGIQVDHEDLAGNMWVNEGEYGKEFGVDDDKNGYVDDINGYNFGSNTGTITSLSHGTHVAGIVAAVSNNGIGVAGVAGGNGNPDSGVKLMAVQIIGGTQNANIYAAMQYAADNGAIISQNSWGFPFDQNILQSTKDAIDYFIDNAGWDDTDGDGINDTQIGPIQGGIVVFAAGNEKTMYSNPGGYENVVSVAALGPDNKKASYTNMGPWVDISAHGGDEVRWNKHPEYGILSTEINNGYSWKSGTSMATPLVSGAIALYISKLVQEGDYMGVTAKQVVDRLYESTRPITNSNPINHVNLGSGLLDVASFIGGANEIAPHPVDDLEATASATACDNISITWTVPADDVDDVSATGFKLVYSKSSIGDIDLENLPTDVKLVESGEFVPGLGEAITFEIYGLSPATEYFFAMFATDYSGNISTISNKVSATTVANNPPEIVPLNGAIFDLSATENMKATFRIDDYEGLDVECAYEGDKASTSYTYNKMTKMFTLFINAVKVDAGSYTSKIIATDYYGAITVLEVKYTVRENNVPTLDKPFEPISILGIGEAIEIKLSDYIVDLDGTDLDVDIEVSNQNVSAKYSNDLLTIKSLRAGSSVIDITATDGKGANVSATINVTSSVDNGSIVNIYPNPVEDIMSISTRETSIEKIKISNSMGATVFEKSDENVVDGIVTVDMTKLNSGIYFVDLTINGESFTKKITKI